MKKIILIAVLFLGAAVFTLSAQNTRTANGIKDVCETFLGHIMDGNYNRAYSYLGSKPSSIPDQELSELEVSSIQQDKTIREIYGKALKVQLVSEENVSDSVLRLVYLVIRENMPIRWKFIYYKPADDWKLVSIEFDDLLEEIF